MADQDPVAVAFDRSGYRLTERRRELAALVAERTGHFTSADLVTDSQTRRLGIGRATIFRTLDVLVGTGLVERVDLPTGEHAYVACAPAHHHHVICSRCGRTAEIEDAGITSIVREVTRLTGFRVDTHRFEMFGLCPACVAASELAPSITSA